MSSSRILHETGLAVLTAAVLREDIQMTESAARAERIIPQSTIVPAYTWEAAQKPVIVRMPFSVIDRMEREVVENFRSLTSRGSEIGGILLGSAQSGNPILVGIEDYETVECDYSRGPLYR